MSREKIKAEVIKQLEAYKKPEIEITEDSIPNQVFATSADQGSVSASGNFKASLIWFLRYNKYWDKKRRFHSNWLDLPISNLLEKLVTIILFASLLTPMTSQAQLEINVGANRTEAKNAALSIGLMYAKSFDSIWNSIDYFVASRNSLFTVAPEIDIQTGNQDAFSSLQFKLSGIFMKFKTEEVEGGDLSIDASKTFHVFPISLGVETSNYFDNLNSIVEVGWIPWYQTNTNPLPELLKRTTVGAWLQGGYKFQTASSPINPTGGKIDESLEDPNSFILRLKSSVGVDTKSLLSVNGLNVGLVGRATGWFDIANGAFYKSIDMRTRFYLTDGSWIDFVWQKGSVAPLFNSGTQTGVTATIKL